MLPARAAEVGAADIIVLSIRLGVIVLGTVLVLRVAGALVSRLEETIRQRSVGEEAARDKRARTIGGVLRGGARSLVFVVAALMAVRELGLDITPALAAAGGFGVAAGLGAQSLVRDWISGFFIIHDDQYGVGDTVRVAGVAGNIEQLTLRHTELRDGDGSLHFIPNGEIKIVTNLTKSWAAPLIRIPVSADEDPERVLRVLNEMVSAFKADAVTAALLVDGPTVLGIDDVSGGQYTVLIQARTRPENRHPATRALRLAAIRRLRAEGIGLRSAPAGETT
ncbi:MAG: mechanosensitive ion channel family protein [Candidatus Eisenbacteria bacterium]